MSENPYTPWAENTMNETPEATEENTIEEAIAGIADKSFDETPEEAPTPTRKPRARKTRGRKKKGETFSAQRVARVAVDIATTPEATLERASRVYKVAVEKVDIAVALAGDTDLHVGLGDLAALYHLDATGRLEYLLGADNLDTLTTVAARLREVTIPSGGERKQMAFILESLDALTDDDATACDTLATIAA